jgi:UDP-glucose 4-epimerase
VRVLITGGSGRLGSSVVERFVADGHAVTVVDTAAAVVPGARLVRADLTDAGAVFDVIGTARPDAVVHLAGLATPFGHPEHVLFAVNSQLAFDVCQAAAVTGVAAVVCASSPTVIGYGNPRGWTPAHLPLDETHPVAPWHAYAMAKVAIETVVRGFAVQAGDATRFFAFRPCYVVTPEEWRGDVITQQGHTMRQRLANPALAAPSLFNYVDARDAASFVAMLVGRAASVPNGETFFVGAADALSEQAVPDVLGRYHPGTVPYLRDLDATASLFDVGRAARLVGWVPERSWRNELC